MNKEILAMLIMIVFLSLGIFISGMSIGKMETLEQFVAAKIQGCGS